MEVKPWCVVVGNTDDNPDIHNHMGYYRLKVGYQLGERSSAREQYNWNTGYGRDGLGVSYPITKHQFRAYTRIYGGYGESLIDYSFANARRRRANAQRSV